MRRRHSILPIAFAASLLGGCLGSFGSPGEGTGSSTATGSRHRQRGSGGGGSGDGADAGGGDGRPRRPTPVPTMPPAAQGSFAAALDKATDSIRLNETKSYTLTLTPSGGLTGGVTLALDTPPAGVSAVFTPATVNITDATPVTVQVAVTVASDTASSATLGRARRQGARRAASPRSASLGVTIPAELLVEIAKGVAIGTAAAPNLTAFGQSTAMNVKYVTGLKITWINNDAINHEIHSDGAGVTAASPTKAARSWPTAATAYTQVINGPASSRAQH